jgi:tRNA-specific 2-thiouridylase
MSFPDTQNSKNVDKIAVALSGGVDSSLAALLLQERGYYVFGITLLLDKDNSVRAEEIISSAKKTAYFLGIEHYVLDCSAIFKREVVDGFIGTYLRGETPNPCVRCNRVIKFGELLQEARRLGADLLATGHYARIASQEGQAELRRGADKARDQSYFLFEITPEQLQFLRFPLGNMSKEDVRKLAEDKNLPAARRPESQDICFVPGGDYAALVRASCPDAIKEGDIVHKDGRVLGRHKGIIHYTIGQRKGLGIGGGCTENNEPLYVMAIDAAKNQVIVGAKEDLTRRGLALRDCNWLADPEHFDDIKVKFRSVMEPASASLKVFDDGAAEIIFDEPQSGISPGQAAVCYDGEKVLGGGWIKSAIESEVSPFFLRRFL